MTRYQKFLIAGLSIIWAWAAYYPRDPQEWLLENILVLLLAGAIFATTRRFTFSNISYTLVAIFLAFHLAGSHYGYTQTPFGYTLRDWLGETRNMYDRLVHLLFGLAFTYPCFEFTQRTLRAHGFTNYYIAFASILACSAVYEILEWLAVRNIDVNASTYFVGAQGDNWDMSKDMALAAIGALIVLAILYIARRRSRKSASR